MTIEESIVESLKVIVSSKSESYSDKMKELCCMIINDPEYLQVMLALINAICTAHPQLGAAFTFEIVRWHVMSMSVHQIKRRLSKIIETNFEMASNPKTKNPKVHRDIAFLAKSIRELHKLEEPTEEVKND